MTSLTKELQNLCTHVWTLHLLKLVHRTILFTLSHLLPLPWSFHLHLKFPSSWACLPMNEYFHLAHLFMMCQVPKCHKPHLSCLNPILTFHNKLPSPPFPSKVYERLTIKLFKMELVEEVMTHNCLNLNLPIRRILQTSSSLTIHYPIA